MFHANTEVNRDNLRIFCYVVTRIYIIVLYFVMLRYILMYYIILNYIILFYILNAELLKRYVNSQLNVYTFAVLYK